MSNTWVAKPRLRIVLPIAALILATFGWLFVRPAHALNTTTLSGTIVDAQGNGINGILTLQLPVPAQFNINNAGCGGGTSQLIQNGLVTYSIVNGNIQSGPPLFDVNCLQPANLFYIATAYDRAGNLIMRGNYVITGASFNIGTATPTTVTTSNISYANVGGSVSTGNPNTWTAPQTFSQINSNTGSIAASGLIRLANTDVIAWRNGNNTSDSQLGLSDSAVGGTTTCTNAAPCLISGGAAQTFAGTGTCPANQFANSLNAIALAVPGTPTCAAITVLASGATGTNTALTTPTIGGTTITNVPGMVWSGFIPTVSINAANTTSFSQWTTLFPISIKSFFINGIIALNNSCGSNPAYSIEDNGSIISTLTYSAATNISNTGINYAMAAGHSLTINQTTGGTGCGTGINANFNVTFQMQ